MEDKIERQKVVLVADWKAEQTWLSVASCCASVLCAGQPLAVTARRGTTQADWHFGDPVELS